jgi:SAM-dependent methyltransferase
MTIRPTDPLAGGEIAQRSYWDSEAPGYDGLYTDPWSRMENQRVISTLGWLRGVERPSVLDLGCGTGLGYELCRSANSDIRYTGLDVAPAMLDRLREKHPGLPVIVGPMERVSSLVDGTYDAVVSFYSSMSYAISLDVVLAECRSVIKPGGHLRVSVLNRRSLRRILHGRLGDYELYRTRHSSSANVVEARCYGRSSVATIGRRLGYELVRMDGISLLGGLLERRGLWGWDQRLATRASGLAHIVDYLFVRQDQGPAGW